MTRPWHQRFDVRGVFWRQFLRWAVHNVPYWLEPIVIGWWSLFFLLWGPGRRGVMRNLEHIKPGSSSVANFFRTYRVFWNFAWTITDNMRFKELRVVPDWEFVGTEHFRAMLEHESGLIMLTAHMGSYDLGAHLFAATTKREIVMVRAPETDPDTRKFEESIQDRTEETDGLRVGFNTGASELAIDLLHAIQRRAVVAIQGDRVTQGVGSVRTTMFGVPADLPAGPFALAMAARAPIFPVFVVRCGRRRYRLVTYPPIMLERRSRKREEDLQRAVDAWSETLQKAIGDGWFQWYAFAPFEAEAAA